jgi:hypothetical protein
VGAHTLARGAAGGVGGAQAGGNKLAGSRSRLCATGSKRCEARRREASSGI